MRKLCRMFLLWACAYMVIATLVAFIADGRLNSVPSLRSWLRTLFHWKTLVRFLLFQDLPGIGRVLWFLPSLIISYGLAIKTSGWQPKHKLWLSAALLCFQLALQWVDNFLGLNLRPCMLGNAWLIGLPMFLLGEEIRRSEAKLLPKLPSGLLIALFLGGCALALFERRLWGAFEYYAGNHISSLAVFLLALKHRTLIKPTNASRQAQALSIQIYQLHTLFVMALSILAELYAPLQPVVLWLGAPIVFALSAGAGCALQRLPKKSKC